MCLQIWGWMKSFSMAHFWTIPICSLGNERLAFGRVNYFKPLYIRTIRALEVQPATGEFTLFATNKVNITFLPSANSSIWAETQSQETLTNVMAISSSVPQFRMLLIPKNAPTITLMRQICYFPSSNHNAQISPIQLCWLRKWSQTQYPQRISRRNVQRRISVSCYLE